MKRQINCSQCGKLILTNYPTKKFCSLECKYKSYWVTGGIFSTQDNKEAEIARRVEKKYSQFEYAGGYVGADGYIYVQCKDCASFFRRSNQNLKKTKAHERWKCPKCEAVLDEISIKKKKEERLRKQQAQKEKRFWSQQFKQQDFKCCKKCGGLMLGKNKYCSAKCAKSAAYEKKDIARRLRIKVSKVDNGITLEKVFFRDKGICYLCGGKCNFDDYSIINGAFISGSTYPTKEHVIPLCRGGKHSWDNIRLACFKCNTEKKDMTYEEFQENKGRDIKTS